MSVVEPPPPLPPHSGLLEHECPQRPARFLDWFDAEYAGYAMAALIAVTCIMGVVMALFGQEPLRVLLR